MKNQLILPPETIRSTIQDYFAASRSQNLVEAMVACFAPDSVNYDPADGPALYGHADLRQFFQQIASLFQTVGLHEEFVSINGNSAAVKWIGRGINQSGKPISFEGIDLFEFNADGKIQSMRAYWNPAAMLAELTQAQPPQA